MRRILFKTAAAAALIAAIAGAGLFVYLRQSLPAAGGVVRVAGLGAPVEIVRDADNVPHIFATTKLDALFGLGYVHAQDRLWQMEFQRRVGHGRLSEIFGAQTHLQDRFLRTVGFGRAAHNAWSRLPDDARQRIDAYIAGVNAYVGGLGASELPPEFTLLRFRPEPWTGPDVIVWVKMMAWDLSANYSFELLRHDLLASVAPERLAELMPPYPAAGLSILENGPLDAGMRRDEAEPPPALAPAVHPRGAGAGAPASWSSALNAAFSHGHASVSRLLFGGARSEGLGSNNWVVGGALTASGRPLLANDPHLGANIPSVWYLAHMSAGDDYDVIGATLPGTPAVALGRNRFIAWGATNVAADVEDLYREQLDSTGTSAMFRGATEPLRIVTERIAVRGSDPVEVQVRLTRHGPLVSDALNAFVAAADDEPGRPPLEPLALRWTALDEDDTTISAFFRLNEARNWTEFTDALREFVVPSQNFVYADVEGHIGYYAPGRIPIRARGDGSRPAEGWTGDMEWIGWVPFDELPHVYDPPDHVIVTANHRPAGGDYAHMIGLDYPNPYRAQRITDLIAGRMRRGPLTTADFRDIQADTVSLHARELLPLLLRHAEPNTDRERRAIDLLEKWDHDAGAASAGAAIFQAWFYNLAPALAGDEIGPAALDAYRGRFSHITRFVVAVLAADEPSWCDDVRSEVRETCGQTVTAALRRGLDDLSQRLGTDVDSWRWGAVHPAVFPHQGLDAVPGLRWFLSRSIASAGDWSTVNVGAVSANRPFEQRSVPGYRQIVDLSDANDSWFLDAVGQSGHPLSRYYDDFLDDWQAVRHRPMRMDRRLIEKGALGTLRLTP